MGMPGCPSVPWSGAWFPVSHNCWPNSVWKRTKNWSLIAIVGSDLAGIDYRVYRTHCYESKINHARIAFFFEMPRKKSCKRLRSSDCICGKAAWNFSFRAFAFTFAQILKEMEQTRKYRGLWWLLFFGVNGWFAVGHFFTLGMADADSSLSNHRFCKSDGHYVIKSWFQIRNKKKSKAERCSSFDFCFLGQPASLLQCLAVPHGRCRPGSPADIPHVHRVEFSGFHLFKIGHNQATEFNTFF